MLSCASSRPLCAFNRGGGGWWQRGISDRSYIQPPALLSHQSASCTHPHAHTVDFAMTLHTNFWLFLIHQQPSLLASANRACSERLSANREVRSRTLYIKIPAFWANRCCSSSRLVEKGLKSQALHSNNMCLQALCSQTWTLSFRTDTIKALQHLERHLMLPRSLAHCPWQQARSSAVRLQAAMRGFLARAQLRRARRAAIRLQSAWRGAAQRARYKAALRHQSCQRAAVQIQAVWRGLQVRRQQREEAAAAVRIQAAWRQASRRHRYVPF